MARILIVDDEVDVAKAWRRALSIAGHTVQIAHNGKDALALSAVSPFDLIVADYIMPSMTGIELLNEIRRKQPLIRSIICSGKLDANVAEVGILAEIRANLDADVFLHKPINNDQLKAEIAKLLELDDSQDWAAVAKARLDSSKPKKAVRAVERSLSKRRIDKTKR